MARTLFMIVFAALVALVSAAANPTYLVTYDTNVYKAPAEFCGNWRNQAVAYAAKFCHHHETNCKVTGKGTAAVFAGMVPFKNTNGCVPSSGPAKVKPTDTTKIVASMAEAHVVKMLSKRRIAKD